MAEDIQKDAPESNAFGEPLKKEGEAHDDTGGGAGEGEGEGEGGEDKGKKFAAIPEDHPTIVALKAQIESVKTEYGTNLSGQRDVIKILEGKIETLMAGKGGGDDKNKDGEFVLFKDIKRSKDLKPEERENMTEAEIRQMDENADIKDGQNKIYAEMMGGKKKEETGAVEDRNNAVRTEAMALAKASAGKEDTALANQIIEAFNMYDQSKIKPEQVKEFVLKAASGLSTYKAPKDAKTIKGNAVKDGGDGSDPHNVDKIVEEAHKAGKGGGYAL